MVVECDVGRRECDGSVMGVGGVCVCLCVRFVYVCLYVCVYVCVILCYKVCVGGLGWEGFKIRSVIGNYNLRDDRRRLTIL